MQVQELVSTVVTSTAATPFAILVNESTVTTTDEVLVESVDDLSVAVMSERAHFVECLEACGDCV